MVEWSEQLEIIKEKISEIFSDQGAAFSQAKAEQFLDVSKNKWAAWKRGQRPSADDLEKIARKLDLSPAWLLLGEGEPDAVVHHGDGSVSIMEAKPYSGPVTESVAAIEQALQGADEITILNAVLGKLTPRRNELAHKGGAYGSKYSARESSFHETTTPYGADACSIDHLQPGQQDQDPNG